MKNTITKAISFFTYLLVFLFPIFFLNITQEYYLTNKMFMMVFGMVFLLFLVLVDFLFHKKLAWKKGLFDNPVSLFLFANLITLVVVSINRVDAFLYPTSGVAYVAGLTIMYFLVHNIFKQKDRKNLMKYLGLSNAILAVLAIIFFFDPFKNVNLPTSIQFLKNGAFTTLGGQLDLMIFLGFFAVLNIGRLMMKKHDEMGSRKVSAEMFTLVSIFLSVIALSLTAFSLYKNGFSLPPFSISWYAAVETLKNPFTFFFGVGQNNFVNLFTQIKPAVYNSTALWNLNFNQASSYVLQLWAEVGLLGVFAFISMLFMLYKKAARNGKVEKMEKPLLYVAIYMILVFFTLPTSQIALFLLFVLLAQFTEDEIDADAHFDTGRVLPLYFVVAIVSLAFLGASGYFMSRAYTAELYFKKSLDGYIANKASDLYENQRMAVITNPYSEKYRLGFAQTNLLIANNLAGKEKAQITDADRQTITQAIQSAISEAKAAAAINPGKASNWENLALIYRNILNVAQGADAWTISAYQRAILADPNNPILRLNLGGVYFSLQNYDEAINMFTQSIGLKPDWPNAHYNLAHAYFQKKDYQKAASEMQNTVMLIDPKTEDYKKANQELDEFKKLLPKDEVKAETQQITPKELSLPASPSAAISPKIQLPKEASPEAK